MSNTNSNNYGVVAKIYDALGHIIAVAKFEHRRLLSLMSSNQVSAFSTQVLAVVKMR